MELTKTVKDKTFDNYFTEVDHCESISEDRPGSMRLFYLNVRSGRIKISDLEKFTMLNIGRYVFSRAKQEQYEKAGNLDAVMQQALRIMRKRGAADTKDTGNELGEIMIYAFLEEKLKAHKLLSKIELSTDAAQYESEADGIHFLCSDGASGSYNQMVFGASNIVGDVKDAINQAFEIIKKISAHEDIEAGDDSKLAITYSPVVQVKFLVDLKNHEILVYNEHNGNRIHVANIRDRGGRNANLTDILLKFEKMNKDLPEDKRKQTIVYFNGRNKAIDAAQRFSDALGYDGIKNDPLLDTLSKDIRQEVHGDYFLADMIRKGIAYHIGYLPASIRARIETLFQDGHITIMFCTSTLLEGVNLPADNLFITDNKIFRSEMEPVDFRNLIGRVGRISFNLFGNVYFVTDEEETVKADDYVRMLQEKVPEQVLSIATNPKVLKKVEKKYVADILKSGSSVIPQRVNENGDPLQSEESYIMMRKFGLILLRDIVEDKDTLVRREFKPFLTDEEEKKIRDKFKNTETIPDDDINTSVDQTKRLIMAIKNDGLCYPKVKDGYFRHDVVLEFLKKLSNVFQWKIYESSTLGKDSLLSWYAVILCEWMEGNGLNYIMRAALKHHRDKPDDFWINRYTKGVYDDTSLIHRNIVFADTLEVIENIVLFSISNYFLRFSNEFRRIKGDDELDANNWYEYVEYGTTNPLTILLQRNGFSRESARFIKENPEYVVKDGSTGKLKLKASLSKCGRTSVENEVEYIRQNVPGIFVDEEG